MRNWVLKTLVLANVALWVGVFNLPDDRLRVVFCDVGQGDGILVSRGIFQMLIDGGPDGRILDCLAKHVPFFDRRIEVVVATHPQSDHIGGLAAVLGRYGVDNFISGPAGNETEGYKKLRSKIQETRSNIRNVFNGDEVRMGGVRFRVVWPTREYLAEHTTGEVKVLGMSTDGTDLNEFGISGVLSFGDFDVLLTGDKAVEPELVWEVEVAKVPHHGSKTGLEKAWWETARPKLAVISVGKRNRYGHPAEETVSMLGELGIKVLRTDIEGEVEIVSDGIKWWVK